MVVDYLAALLWLFVVAYPSAFSDVIRTPLKVDNPALPGAQEWNPTPVKGREGVACSRSGRPLADHDGPWLGPGIEPRGIGGFAAVVR